MDAQSSVLKLRLSLSICFREILAASLRGWSRLHTAGCVCILRETHRTGCLWRYSQNCVCRNTHIFINIHSVLTQSYIFLYVEKCILLAVETDTCTGQAVHIKTCTELVVHTHTHTHKIHSEWENYSLRSPPYHSLPSRGHCR